MTLLLVHEDGQVFPFQPFIDDPLVGTTKVMKGGKVEGMVDLDRRYPKLAESLSRGGMDLFWGYRLVDVHNAASERMGGWAFLSQIRK
jgi:hypothetical protein